jgi:hypothetical protein
LLPKGVFDGESEIVITMDSATVESLHGENYSLHAFSAVQSNPGRGRPLVWSTDQAIQTTMHFSWGSQLQVFTSRDEIVDDRPVNPGFITSISPGQELQVNKIGNGQVVQGEAPRAVSIHNQSNQGFTCGIARMVNHSFQLVCAFPLYGGTLKVIAPVEKVLLAFTTQRVKLRQVVYALHDPSVMVECTTLSQRALSFDINKGWSWVGGSWAKSYAAKTDLVGLLIEEPTPVQGARGTARSLIGAGVHALL